MAIDCMLSLQTRGAARAVLAAAFTLALSACGDNGGGWCDGCGGVTGYQGMVSGLAGGTSMVLQDNLGATTSVSGNGSFSLATAAPGGFPALLGVLAQPAGQQCNVSNGAEGANGIVAVTIACAAIPGGATSLVSAYAGMLLTGSADATGTAASFNVPKGVAADGAGNLYVADRDNDTIRLIAPGGIVTTVAGTAGEAGSTDAQGAAARFNAPYGIAVGPGNTLYVADYGNSTIRKITLAGATATVTTLAGAALTPGSADGTGAAARFYGPTALAVDGAGNVYVADFLNDTIRMVTSAGVVTTLAGYPGVAGSSDGTGSSARFYGPRGIAIDGSGNLYVADEGNDTIRKITVAGGVGTVTTLAGTPNTWGSANGATTAATFNAPLNVAVDGSGNVYVADFDNSLVRKITVATSQVSTVAGVARQPVFDAGVLPGSFAGPIGVALYGSSLYVIDNGGIALVTNTP